ncbi:hypothetical protein ACTFIY_011699 [Dictyostelium cf. discoideum]
MTAEDKILQNPQLLDHSHSELEELQTNQLHIHWKQFKLSYSTPTSTAPTTRSKAPLSTSNHLTSQQKATHWWKIKIRQASQQKKETNESNNNTLEQPINTNNPSPHNNATTTTPTPDQFNTTQSTSNNHCPTTQHIKYTYPPEIDMNTESTELNPSTPRHSTTSTHYHLTTIQLTTSRSSLNSTPYPSHFTTNTPTPSSPVQVEVPESPHIPNTSTILPNNTTHHNTSTSLPETSTVNTTHLNTSTTSYPNCPTSTTLSTPAPPSTHPHSKE